MRAHFGYKRHVAVCADHKIIVDSTVTAANVHYLKRSRLLLEKVPIGSAVYGDRGYDTANFRTHIDTTGREPKIAFRSPKKELESMKFIRTETNRLIAKTRARVEYVFGAIQHDMGCTLHRGIGLRRAQSELQLEHVVYNFRRLVFLVGESES